MRDYSDLDDADLVRLLREGDYHAFDALHLRHRPLVGSICRRMELSAADSDDLEIEVFTEIWEKLVRKDSPYQEQGSFPGWLGTLTGNRCRDWKRRLKRSDDTVSLDDLAADGVELPGEPSPEEEVLRKLLASAGEHDGIRRALRRLAAGDRLLFYLQYLHELTARQNAGVLRMEPEERHPWIEAWGDHWLLLELHFAKKIEPPELAICLSVRCEEVTAILDACKRRFQSHEIEILVGLLQPDVAPLLDDYETKLLPNELAVIRKLTAYNVGQAMPRIRRRLLRLIAEECSESGKAPE